MTHTAEARPWSSVRCGRTLLWSVALALLATADGRAQEPVEPDLAPRLPISLSDIPTSAVADGALLDQADVLQSRSAIFDRIEDDLLTRERVVAERLVSLRGSLAATSSRAAMSEVEQEWLDVDGVAEEWEQELRGRTGVIDQQLTLLEARLEVWGLTVQAAEAGDAPDELLALAGTTRAQVAQATESVRALRDRALALQGKVGRARATIREALDMVAAEEANLLSNLARRERPALWSEAVSGVEPGELVERARRELIDWWSSIASVLRRDRDRLVFQILVLIVAGGLLYRARRFARGRAAADPSLASAMTVFERPFALAALGALLVTPWLYVSIPPAVDDAIGLLLVVPVLRLVLPLLDKPVRLPLYFLAGLYVVDRFRDLVEAAPLVARLIFLAEMVVGVAIVLWLLRSASLGGADESGPATTWRGRIRVALYAALSLQTVAILAGTAGFVRLAVLLGTGVLNSAYLALLLAALLRAADALVALTLRSPPAQALHIIKARTPTLRRGLRRLLGIAAGVGWGLVTLDLFALLDYSVGLAGAVLFAELQAGTIAVSLADVLAFVITILTAIYAAQLLTQVLEEDVYTRVTLGRGVPFAISSVVRYGVIAVGFLLAVGAMGVGMDRLAILLGAFGVGLGFGLQNIVNNFVSGMILIFERPVSVGDSIELGAVTGRVTRIGIRSSTVRSFEGADVTIPNGTLLSDALTNWTMTDRARRLEIPVGVAYGTDPEEVLAVLRSVLEGQPKLLAQPAPQVLFSGFGDSSLDFILRAWVADNDEFVGIRSSVAVAVNRALTERDIEIPFPQRDLHVRSVAPGVGLSPSP